MKPSGGEKKTNDLAKNAMPLLENEKSVTDPALEGPRQIALLSEKDPKKRHCCFGLFFCFTSHVNAQPKLKYDKARHSYYVDMEIEPRAEDPLLHSRQSVVSLKRCSVENSDDIARKAKVFLGGDFSKLPVFLDFLSKNGLSTLESTIVLQVLRARDRGRREEFFHFLPLLEKKFRAQPELETLLLKGIEEVVLRNMQELVALNEKRPYHNLYHALELQYDVELLSTYFYPLDKQSVGRPLLNMLMRYITVMHDFYQDMMPGSNETASFDYCNKKLQETLANFSNSISMMPQLKEKMSPIELTFVVGAFKTLRQVVGQLVYEAIMSGTYLIGKDLTDFTKRVPMAVVLQELEQGCGLRASSLSASPGLDALLDIVYFTSLSDVHRGAHLLALGDRFSRELYEDFQKECAQRSLSFSAIMAEIISQADKQEVIQFLTMFGQNLRMEDEFLRKKREKQGKVVRRDKETHSLGVVTAAKFKAMDGILTGLDREVTFADAQTEVLNRIVKSAGYYGFKLNRVVDPNAWRKHSDRLKRVQMLYLNGSKGEKENLVRFSFWVTSHQVGRYLLREQKDLQKILELDPEVLEKVRERHHSSVDRDWFTSVRQGESISLLAGGIPQ